MKFKQFDGVRLITDKYVDQGFQYGIVGTIMDVYDGGAAYEVDFTSLEDEDPTLVKSFKEDELELED